MKQTNNKRVLIIYTGGTIGMQKTADGYQPQPGLLQSTMAGMPEFKHPDMPAYQILEYPTLIDSSNVTPKQWNQIASDIRDHYADHDGFVILHGTDTMAYTASALSFMLEGLRKPVILTGSQVPLIEIRNDVKGNLLGALLLAANDDYALHEVGLFFYNTLFRGNCSKKIDACSFAAFTSPNMPPLAKIGINIEVKERLLFRSPATDLHIQFIENQAVGIVQLFPGMPMDILKHCLAIPLKAIILETFGSGNAPQTEEFFQIIQQAIDAGIIIVNCSQCLHANVNMKDYATGSAMRKFGVIGAGTMTIEATLTKLLYLLSKKISNDEVKSLLTTNLRGELP